MNTARPVESRLPEILEGISAPRTPDYFDDILGQVGRTRQRPGWSFPERWLPMTALSERVATAPRIPMRMGVWRGAAPPPGMTPARMASGSNTVSTNFSTSSTERQDSPRTGLSALRPEPRMRAR